MGPYFFQNKADNAVSANGPRYRAMITDYLWNVLEDMDVQKMRFQEDGVAFHAADEFFKGDLAIESFLKELTSIRRLGLATPYP